MVRQENNDISVFSFFSGSGFLDLGFETEGFDVCYVNEHYEPFLSAYKHSRSVMGHSAPEYGYDSASIEDIETRILAERMLAESRKGRMVGFVGGPPCPDFSIAGKNRGKDGNNGRLSQVYIDLACRHKPDFFVFENVKGLYRTQKHREFFDQLKRKAKRSGYHLHERLVNAIEFGVPQDRQRIILMGFRDKGLPEEFEWLGVKYPDNTAFDFDWPQAEPVQSRRARNRKSSLPEDLCVQHWFEQNDVRNHPNTKHYLKPRAGLIRFQTVDEGDDSKKSYKRLHRWRYSPTVAYGNNEVHIHPYKARRITVAEALSLQSMPRKFELPPDMTITNMFKTIGNGVPFLLAKSMAQSISNHLEKNDARVSKRPSKSYQAVA